ncbi:MAG TPA: YsnF/AvaK domain-containing protein [Nitrospiraceae bacterium]|nr:YsnF/AvaK domain-containing protein [Nitrospiraceae bacterium]
MTTAPKQTSSQQEASSREGPEEAVVPIVQEELHVEKQKVETGRVRLTKTVQEREVLVHEPSIQEDIQIERVPVNRWLSEPASVRYEGDIMIIPVMEEVPVVEKRLRLKEELRVTKRRITTQRTEPVRLRTEEVQVERIPAQSPSMPPMRFPKSPRNVSMNDPPQPERHVAVRDRGGSPARTELPPLCRLALSDGLVTV